MLCDKVFCCLNCRKKHVDAEHPQSVADCPLCNSEPIIRFAGAEPLINHIADHHLPLVCLKCKKFIQSEADMRKLDHSCILTKVENPPEVVVTTSTDPPERERSMAQLKTPRILMTQIAEMQTNNLARCASTTYMKNGCSSQVTTRLIRSTSTPTVQELTCVLKTTNQFLNGSVSHMSSIYNQSSMIATTPLGCTPMAPKVEKFKIPMHQKMRARGSNVTPLRQVMSQNVQRALLNHDFLTGACPSMYLLTRVQHKSRYLQNLNCSTFVLGPGSIPLDLRTRKSPEPTEPDCDAVEQVDEVATDNLQVVEQVAVLKTPVKDYEATTKESPDDCEFFTPHNGRFRRRRSSIFVQVDEYECDDSTADGHIEVVSAVPSSFDSYHHSVVGNEEQEPKISLWNVLSTVFRFASNRIMPKTESTSTELKPIRRGKFTFP